MRPTLPALTLLTASLLGAAGAAVAGPPSAYRLTGPSRGRTSSPSAEFRVALGPGPLATAVAVTPGDGGAGGEFFPARLTLSETNRSATFRYVPAVAGRLAIACASGGALVDPPPLPYNASGRGFAQALATWEATMTAYTPWSAGGRKYLDAFAPLTAIADLDGGNHYDPIAVYRNVRRYTGDPAWDDVVDVAIRQIRDDYYLTIGGAKAYHAFAEGIAGHYLETLDRRDRDALYLLANNAFNDPHFDPLTGGYANSWIRSREVALCGIAALLGESAIGLGHRQRLDDLKGYALGHLDQWRDPDDPCIAVQPFMVGITLHFLIRYHDRYRDTAIPPAIKGMIDWLRAHAWIASNWSWPYWDRDTAALAAKDACQNPGILNSYDGAGQPSDKHAVLNPLIAHAYAWYARYSGDPSYRVAYDEAFIGSTAAGGVDGRLTLDTQKQYNQAYWIEPDALRYRRQFQSPPPRATAYAATATAPLTGEANRPGPPIRVALPAGTRVDAPVAIAFHDGDSGGAFLPPDAILTTDLPEALVRYVPPPEADGRTVRLSMTNDGGLGDPAPLSFAASGLATLATAVELIPPPTSHGPGSPSPAFTLRLVPPGSVPPRSADVNGGLVLVRLGDNYAGGDFAPPRLVLSAEVPQATFTYNPGGATAATRPIGFNNDGGLGYLGTPSTYATGEDPPVSTYTLAGPASGVAGTDSAAFTVTLGFGAVARPIRITPRADRRGTFAPAHLDLTGSARSGSFTFRADESGAIRVGAANDAGLVDPTPRDFSASPYHVTRVIDDSDPRFTVNSPAHWTPGSGLGYKGGYRVAASNGRGTRTATWTFDRLQPGSRVRFAATWPASSYWDHSAVYSLRDSAGRSLASQVVDQAAATGTRAGDFAIQGGSGPAQYRWLGPPIVVPANGVVRVVLRDATEGVAADAIYATRQDDPPPRRAGGR